MSVKVNGLNETIGAVQALTKIWDKPLSKAVGDKGRSIVIRRTRQGRDAHGKAFIPYAKSYQKTGRPNLTESGYMLDSITVEVHDDFVRIYIPGSDGDKNFDIALVHNEGGKSGRLSKPFRMPKREFFGIFTDDEITAIRKVIEAKFNEAIRRLNR
jgi:phage gpG-like protein